MAIRNDITFNWESSPRQITVDAPSIEFTMQDILDTLRHNEALDTNIDNPSIVIGSGKVVLDDQGNAVGLTVQLINATIGFEVRSGPTWIECNLLGGNLSGLEADESTVTTIVTHNNPYVNINKTSSVSATISTVNTGSGVTPQDIIDITDAVWDETLSEHLTAGSTGEGLDTASTGSSLTPTEVADAVWDALGDNYLTTGTLGAAIRRMLEDVSYPLTSAEVVNETHLTIFTDASLTTPVRVINIGTSDIPKRVIVP